MVSPGQTWDCHLTLGASMKSINLHKLAKNFAKTRYGSWGGPPWCSFSPCLAAASLTYFHRSHQESWCRPYLKHWVRLFGFDGFRWLETVDFTMGWYHTNGWGLRPAQCLAPTLQPLDLPIFFLQGLSCARFTVESSSIPLSVSVWKKFHIFARRVVIVLLQQRDWWQNLPNIVGGDEMSHQRRRWCDAAADFTQRKKLTSCTTQIQGGNFTEYMFQIETG